MKGTCIKESENWIFRGIGILRKEVIKRGPRIIA
jgi:hypothetical protein